MSNPFKNWTQMDVEKFNAKNSPMTATAVNELQMKASMDERLLHNEILKECEKRGWLAFHGSTAHRTYRTVGEFDFIILADRGRNFHIECKTKTGKLTPEQAGIHKWANKLGHCPYVVRSFEEFLEVVK